MRKRMKGLSLSGAVMFALFLVVFPVHADHLPSHDMFVSGISTITSQCEYVPFLDSSNKPQLDELGIPKPSTLPPTCRKDAAGKDVSCALARNLQPTNINPPCAGSLSAVDITGPAGCVDPESNNSDCGINTPTWYYGYCGQTYGGATGGTFKINGITYAIEKMGFTRGRGAWEFGGRMHKTGGPTIQFRMHLGAVPDKPDQLAGCDATHNITSVEFAGTLDIYNGTTPVPPKIFRTSVGWHWCDDDQPFKSGTPGEGC